MSSAPKRPTVLIADRYRLQKKLGSGAAGVVYLALDERLDRKVAVKLLHPHEQKAGGEARFVHEARAAAKLDHPGLCSVFDFGRYGDRLFLVMAYIDGVALSDLIASKRSKIFRLAWRLNVVSQIADAMSTSHEAGIVHYDLKPENVLIRRSDHRPVVMDFGLAGAAQSVSDDDKAFFGSPAYMSPEQARGEMDKLGTHSDIYSLGATLYELLTGGLPFDGSLDEVMEQLRDPEQMPAFPISVKPGIPETLSQYCYAMLSKSIEARPESMRHVCQRLTAIHSDLSTDPVSVLSEAEVQAGIRSTIRSTPPSLTQTQRANPQSPDLAPPDVVRGSLITRGRSWLKSPQTWPKFRDPRSIRAAAVAGGLAFVLGIGSWAAFPKSNQLADDSTRGFIDGSLPAPTSTVSLALQAPPAARGGQAIDWFLETIARSRPKREPFTVDFLKNVTDLRDWKVCPHEQRTQWQLLSDEVLTGANGGAPSVCYYPSPVDEFELSFEYLRTSNTAVQLVWMETPGWSSTATASLTFNPAGRNISTWKCYQTGRSQSQTYYGNEKFDPWVRVTVSSDGYTVFVQVPGKQPARFSRTGGGRIQGYLGLRQMPQGVQVRNLKLVDRTINRSRLWSEHPREVFVDTETSEIESPRLDIWNHQLAILQQPSEKTRGASDPVRFGTIFDIENSGGRIGVHDRSRSRIDWVALCEPKSPSSQSLALVAGKGQRVSALPLGQTQLVPSAKPFPKDMQATVRWDVHHRWTISRTVDERNEKQFQVIGMTPDALMFDLASSGATTPGCRLAVFAANGKRWLLAGDQKLFLRSVSGKGLDEQFVGARIDAITITDDGRRAIVATEENSLIFYEWTSSGDLFKVFPYPIPTRVDAMEISPDGRYALAEIGKHRNVLFDAKTGELKRIFENTVSLGVFAADSRSVVIPFRSDAVVKVYRIDTMDASREETKWYDLRKSPQVNREKYSQTQLGSDLIER